MNKLQRCMIVNRDVRAGRRFEVVNNAAEGDAPAEATIFLYDSIVSSAADAQWFGGVAAETFVQALNAITAPVINLRINSPGGDVFAGRAMEAAIKNHASKIIAHIDGYAASAASYVAIAADEVEISPGSFLMIHNAWSIQMGDANDMRATANLLDQIDNTLVATYAAKTGLASDLIKAMMTAETWIGADEAVSQGFADRIAADPVKNSVAWDVTALGGPEPKASQVAVTVVVTVDDDDDEPDADDGAAAAQAAVAAKARATAKDTDPPPPAPDREHYVRLQSHVERIAA